MPIYEYRCEECSDDFEALVLPNRSTFVACPSCGSEAVERALSLPSVQTDGTRGRALESAHRRKAKLGRERVEEQRRYEEAHEGH